MDAKAWLAIPGVIALIISAVYGMEGRYITVAKATEMIEQQDVETERGKLETQAQLIEHEMEFIETTNDDLDEPRVKRKLDYLEERLHIIQQRLIELEDKE